MKNQLLNKGYKESMITEEIQKVNNKQRIQLLNKEKTPPTNRITLSITYNKTLPNIKGIIEKHWHILHVNSDLEKVFHNKPLFAFRKNTNLKQILGGHIIENIKKAISSAKLGQGTCTPCYSNSRTLCCKQVQKTETFKSNQTNEVFKIFHTINCKSNFIIYLMECKLCKLQYVGKAETAFNIRLNNHRKDIKDPKAIPADKHFNQPQHSFNNHAKFILIEQLQNIDKTSTETLKDRLKKRESFWIKKLKTLKPHGLNHETN